MIRLVCVIIGYVFGLFQTSYLYGKKQGIDIRTHGSGNAGTTNALRTLGWKAGLVTLLGDACKCILAVLLVKALFGKTYPEMKTLLGVYAAFGVILGHNFPFYLKFKGGKGIAATAGMIITLSPLLTLAELITFIAVVGLTRYVSLGSILVVIEMLIWVIAAGVKGGWEMSQPYVIEMDVVIALMTAMALYRHRANIKRLLSGTERKIGEKAE